MKNLTCPNCQSASIKKNGFTSYGKQNYFCSSGLTSYIERFNNTLRQRCSRLVRKTLSFSKNEIVHDNLIGWYINTFYFKSGIYANTA